jgi:hypothetical protein
MSHLNMLSTKENTKQNAERILTNIFAGRLRVIIETTYSDLLSLLIFLKETKANCFCCVVLTSLLSLVIPGTNIILIFGHKYFFTKNPSYFHSMSSKVLNIVYIFTGVSCPELVISIIKYFVFSYRVSKIFIY